jgi:hypothetical protein
MRRSVLAWAAGLALAAGSAGCGSDDRDDAPAEREAPPPPAPTTVLGEPEPAFVDVAAESGLDFVHNTGAFGDKWLPETMGSGCAWVDWDLDGDPDALLLSGRDFDGHPTGGRQTPALFRNDGGRFTDVTAEVGLDVPTYAMGVTHADFDADGDPDLYVTALGPNRLFRNDGADGFRDVAEALGVAEPGFGSSASWFDFDNDGDLDLFSLNYVAWTRETDIFCSLDGTNKSYCTPEVYPGTASRLFRNDGDRFRDVTREAGVFDDTGKGLGIVCADLDLDGWVDVFVANDTQPNFLWHNNGDGTFSEEALLGGVAFDETGRARGAMGVDFADYDGSGLPSLVIGNFSNEMLALYHNEGGGLFIDAAPTSELGHESLLTLAFATFFFDWDLDGLEDIFVANGHVENEIQKVQARVSYAQPCHLFRNVGEGRFVDVAPESEVLSEPIVGRAAATADYDGDGDLDVLVTTSGGPARLLRNDGANGRSIRVRLVGGAGSNPDGLGACVEVDVAGETRRSWLRAAHSYCSQSEAPMTFGLGAAGEASEVRVFWPSGKTSRRSAVRAGDSVVFREQDAT